MRFPPKSYSKNLESLEVLLLFFFPLGRYAAILLEAGCFLLFTGHNAVRYVFKPRAALNIWQKILNNFQGGSNFVSLHCKWHLFDTIMHWRNRHGMDTLITIRDCKSLSFHQRFPDFVWDRLNLQMRYVQTCTLRRCVLFLIGITKCPCL